MRHPARKAYPIGDAQILDHAQFRARAPSVLARHDQAMRDGALDAGESLQEPRDVFPGFDLTRPENELFGQFVAPSY